nr:MAG TPA: hypothetical protein [Caudoviricetes sp.]
MWIQPLLVAHFVIYPVHLRIIKDNCFVQSLHGTLKFHTHEGTALCKLQKL